MIVYGDERAGGSEERFGGIYLPSLWSPGDCCRVPVCLGSIPGHFVALVPVPGTTSYYPLTDANRQPLSVRFEGRATQAQHEVLRRWLQLAPGHIDRAVCDPASFAVPPETESLLRQYTTEALLRFQEQPEV